MNDELTTAKTDGGPMTALDVVRVGIPVAIVIVCGVGFFNVILGYDQFDFSVLRTVGVGLFVGASLLVAFGWGPEWSAPAIAGVWFVALAMFTWTVTGPVGLGALLLFVACAGLLAFRIRRSSSQAEKSA